MCLPQFSGQKEKYANFMKNVATNQDITELENKTDFNREKIESFKESFYYLKMFELQEKNNNRVYSNKNDIPDAKYIHRNTFVDHLCVISSQSVLDLANRIFVAVCTKTDKMSFIDYVKYYDILQSKNIEKKLMFNFLLIDQAKKEQIDKSDFKSFIVLFFKVSENLNEDTSARDQTKREKWIDQLVDRFFEVFDEDQDGLINEKEFLTMGKINPTMSDILFNLAGGVTDIVNNQEHDKFHNCLSEVYVAKKEVENIKSRVENLQNFESYGSSNSNMKSHKANHLNTQFPTSNFNNQIPIENLETE